ncbi:hypothetical protein [Oscillatoria salina]|uniref:hypothetical protein n=1 Tax=Oscillatoria salina TaxID=331517 RepID=UPI001CCD9E26|nr:hypothetical protein [Oscillatoria salina]MBZ8181879.1 hypothetical protein [Oscillatoria salina IIICB1]
MKILQFSLGADIRPLHAKIFKNFSTKGLKATLAQLEVEFGAGYTWLAVLVRSRLLSSRN